MVCRRGVSLYYFLSEYNFTHVILEVVRLCSEFDIAVSPIIQSLTVQDDLVNLLNVVVMMPDFELGDQVNSLSLSSCSLSS